MEAIVCTQYGSPDYLRLEETPKPVPADDEILIKIYAAPVTALDRRVRGLDVPSAVAKFLIQLLFGFKKPRKKILGWYVAGEIEAIGKKVENFHITDQVYARTGMHMGAYAQYVCLPAKGIIIFKPKNVSYAEAAAIPSGGLTALYFLRKAHIQALQKVLIYGASGATGTAAVQLAKYFGAEVTGVCSGPNLKLIKSIGADHGFDYTAGDFTAMEEKFDLVFDAVGKTSEAACKNLLTPQGKFVSVMTSGKVKVLKDDLIFLTQLTENGKFKPVIDREYPLAKTAEAHRYADQGHVKGNVIITVKHND